MKNFSSSPLHSNNQTPNHIRERNNRKINLLSAIPLRFSLRGYGFCMATLFFFCLGSLFYQLNGGPPKILLDIRQYLGKNLIFLCWLSWSVSSSKRFFGLESCTACLDALLWLDGWRTSEVKWELIGLALLIHRWAKVSFMEETPQPHSPQKLSWCPRLVPTKWLYVKLLHRLTRFSESVMMC